MNEDKRREGWVWKETKSGGYYMKQTNPAHKHKHSMFCPHCRKISGTVDNDYMDEHGVCYECFTMYIDARKEPAIDIEKYKKK